MPVLVKERPRTTIRRCHESTEGGAEARHVGMCAWFGRCRIELFRVDEWGDDGIGVVVVAGGGGSKIDAKTKRGLRGDFDGDDGV